MNDIAVVMLVHSRPEHTARVLDSVQAYRPQRLYVVADGPREDRGDEADLCQQTRALFANLDWPCHVRTRFRPTNLGIEKSVKDGLGWVFSLEPAAIVLEDDTLPTRGFFSFCEQMLKQYAGDPNIGMVSGRKISPNGRSRASTVSRSRVAGTWGWATWATEWNSVDWEMSWRHDCETETLRKISLNRKHFYYWTWVLHLLDNKLVDTWDYQWSLSRAVSGKESLTPAMNLVENIGFGSGATHTHRIPRGFDPTMGEIGVKQVFMPARKYSSHKDRRHVRRFFPERRPERLWLRRLASRLVNEPVDFVYRNVVRNILARRVREVDDR